MDRIYTIEDARERLNKRLDYYTARVEAWEKVERLRKKDGGDFAIISKNFTNCRFYSQFSSNYIHISFRSKFEGCTFDEINLSGNAYGVEPADTADKIEKRIAGVIATYKKHIETTEKAIETIEEQLNAISPEIEALKKAIEKAKETDCQYILGSYIKESLRII